MEFGFEPVCDQVRAGASYLSPVRSWCKHNSITLSWSKTGPKLVADLLARASSLLAS